MSEGSNKAPGRDRWGVVRAEGTYTWI